jgi:hypothetical protein
VSRLDEATEVKQGEAPLPLAPPSGDEAAVGGSEGGRSIWMSGVKKGEWPHPSGQHGTQRGVVVEDTPDGMEFVPEQREMHGTLKPGSGQIERGQAQRMGWPFDRKRANWKWFTRSCLCFHALARPGMIPSVDPSVTQHPPDLDDPTWADDKDRQPAASSQYVEPEQSESYKERVRAHESRMP